MSKMKCLDVKTHESNLQNLILNVPFDNLNYSFKGQIQPVIDTSNGAQIRRQQDRPKIIS